MYAALHPKSDEERRYIGRKDEGRGLIGWCNESVTEKENSLSLYVKNSSEKSIDGDMISGTVEKENCVRTDIFKRERKETLKRNWRQKKMNGQFLKDIPDDIDLERSWRWLS